MRGCEPTDDLGLSPEFLADEDVARDYDNYPCAGPGDCVDDFGNLICPGCRRCLPVDPECKPYGFGIETFEDQALQAANEDVRNRWVGGPYRNLAASGNVWPAQYDLRQSIRYRLSTQSKLRLWHSERVWDRCCDECETHPDAVERYKRWAEWSVRRRYPDEQ